MSEGTPKTYVDPRLQQNEELLARIKVKLPELKKLLEDISGEWAYEEGVYRFYHQSFKVYYMQGYTKQMVEALKQLADPELGMNQWFLDIVAEGTGKRFEPEHNNHWMKHTRPIVEAFFHAKYFLEMTVKYGESYEQAPTMLDYGWAAVLYLFNQR